MRFQPTAQVNLEPVDNKVWDERYAGTELVWTSEPNRFLVERAAGLAPGRTLDALVRASLADRPRRKV